MILFVDFETTGLVDFKSRWDQPHQPHIVSVGLVAYDEVSRQETHSAHLIVKPEGWTIPEAASNVHGITTEIALKHGIKYRVILPMLEHLWFQARRVVIFNAQFELAMLKIENLRLNRELKTDFNKVGCLMLESAGILRIPGEYDDYKWPKLGEVYEWVYQNKLQGAHNSLADARASAWITFVFLDWGYVDNLLYATSNPDRRWSRFDRHDSSIFAEDDGRSYSSGGGPPSTPHGAGGFGPAPVIQSGAVILPVVPSRAPDDTFSPD